MRRNGSIELFARDDGRGAAEVQADNGLRGIRERLERSGGAADSGAAGGRISRARHLALATSAAVIRVALVENEALVRQGLRRVLELDADVTVIAEARDGEEALRVIAEGRPDVVLLDQRMPRLDGVGVLRALGQGDFFPPCLLLTTFDDPDVLLQALRAGARGYLLKDASLEQLSAAIRCLAEGGSFVQPGVTESVMRAIGPARSAEAEPACESLTERELEVLRLMAGGYSNREIARGLFVAERTVKNHVSSILAKLYVRDRIRAVLKALGMGLL